MTPDAAAGLAAEAGSNAASGAGAGLRVRIATHPAVIRWGRVLASPWPVLTIGALITILQVAGRAWPAHDAAMYWDAAHRLGDLYPETWGHLTYASPPPIAQAFSLLTWLPWPLMLIGWQVLLWGSLWYATRPFTLPVIAVGFVGLATGIPIHGPVSIVLIGNAGMLMTAAVVATIRHPAANAVAALTKLGPSIALLWHAKTPRAFAVGAGVTLAAFAVSFALTPAAWLEWFVFVRDNTGHSPVGELAVPFVVRAPVGIAVVLVATWRERPWLVPIGAGLALPADYGTSFLTVWIGALGLLRASGQEGGAQTVLLG